MSVLMLKIFNLIQLKNSVTASHTVRQIMVHISLCSAIAHSRVDANELAAAPINKEMLTIHSFSQKTLNESEILQRRTCKLSVIVSVVNDGAYVDTFVVSRL